MKEPGKSIKDCKIAIIGAGPAGMACAIQLKRYGFNPVIFEKNKIGGLLLNANLVENYPGFPEALSGPELVEKFHIHLKKLDIAVNYQNVSRVIHEKNGFILQTSDKYCNSDILVVASGSIAKNTSIKIDKAFENKVFYEIDKLYSFLGKGLIGKKIVIIGSGDAAFDYAINLVVNTSIKQVIILNRSTRTKCLELLKQRALNHPKISYLENQEPVALLNNNGLIKIVCGSGLEIESDYLLFAIGRDAYTGFLDQTVETSGKVLEEDKKLFFIGDVKNNMFRQSVIAAGDGIKTAMEIYLFSGL